VQHLFASTAQILRMTEHTTNGMPTFTWGPVALPLAGGGVITLFKCRVDVQFVSASRQQPLVIEAGRAPDRVGTVWVGPEMVGLITPGDRIQLVAGPITGTFSVDEIPEQVGDFSGLHHLEIGVKEVAQQIAQVGG
jgi:hypothetical protein